MKIYEINEKELLQSYFGADAENLELVNAGKITSIEIVIDNADKSALYRITNRYNDGIYWEDDYESVIEFLEDNFCLGCGSKKTEKRRTDCGDPECCYESWRNFCPNGCEEKENADGK